MWWCCGCNSTPTVYIRLAGVPGSRTSVAVSAGMLQMARLYISDILSPVSWPLCHACHAQPGWSWNCTLRSSRPDKTVTDDCFLRGHLLAAKADLFVWFCSYKSIPDPVVDLQTKTNYTYCLAYSVSISASADNLSSFRDQEQDCLLHSQTFV